MQMQAAEPCWCFSVHGGPAPITADAERIEQVLFNLLNYPVKYSASGGEVRVEVECRDDLIGPRTNPEFDSPRGKGESRLFAHAMQYPFVPIHLPLYAAMAVFVALAATAFVTLLQMVQRRSRALPLPAWARPALGGLAVGIVATPVIAFLGPRVGDPGQGFGILGGGYGAAQVAITGAPWVPEGWRAVELLALLGCVKIVVTCLTVGSGGSAGDFGPSLVIGGLFGGAFGHAAQLLFHDPRIDPGAFALVGMGTFYGGLAHVPVSSLVMTCELAGSYDLLVPLMLAEGIAFVLLRKRSLYHAQVATKRDSPAHAHEMTADTLGHRTVGEIVERGRAFVSFAPNASLTEVLTKIAGSEWQDVFPVVDAAGGLLGLIDIAIARRLAMDLDRPVGTIAADLMRAPVFLRPETTLHDALEVMSAERMRELPVLATDGAIVGFLDEADVTAAYLQSSTAPVAADDRPA